MDEFSIFAFAETFARDFGRLDNANKFFGIVGVLGSIAGPTYFTTRYVTRRLMRRRADDLKMERDGLQKALDAGARIRSDLEKDIKDLQARLRLESPIEWIALAREARATGSEGKAIRLLSDAFDGTADQLGAVARDLALHHLTTMVLTPKLAIERAERFVRLAHACLPEDVEAAEILAEIIEIKAGEKLRTDPGGSASNMDADELIDLLYGGKGDPVTLVKRLNQTSFQANSAGTYRTAFRLAAMAQRTGRVRLTPEHPLTLSASGYVAYAMHGLGRSAEALEILETILPIMEQVNGTEHSDTLSLQHLHACVLACLGRLAEALEIVETLLPLQKKVFGAEEWRTLATRYLHAQVLDRLGRSAEALEILETLLPIDEKVKGAEHPETLATQYLLAHVLDRLGRSAEVLEILETLLPLEEKVKGAEHPGTLITRYRHAHVLDTLGRSAEARAILDEIVPVWRTKVLASTPRLKDAETLWEKLKSKE